MLPQSYELPAALVLVFAGALACFAGYRLFRYVLAIFGFILGAMLSSSVIGISNTVGMVVAALAGGLIGAAILLFAYFVGIALVGAGVGALFVQFGWGLVGSGDPPALAMIGMAILGAVVAMFIQRQVIVLTTAFGGAWTLIVGILAAAGRTQLPPRATASVWILYPTSPAPGERWIPFAWIVLGIAGTAVQLSFKGKNR
jgi:uncharacterized protein DUF4203